MTTHRADRETEIQALLQSGQTDKAVDRMAALAMAYAKEKNFEKAEAWRDQVYAVDSMALSHIVSINECIEDEKSKSLTGELRQRWDRFFKGLSSEEANAFFLSLNTLSVDADQQLLWQGQPNDRLYLINSGKLNLFHDSPHKRLFIKSLGAGDTVGEDTFFSVNVCTFAATAMLKSQVSYLDRARLAALKPQFPQLVKHLKTICEAGGGIFSWLRQKGMDRRQHKRIHFVVKATFQVLPTDDRTAPSSPVTAEIWDVSKSGLSFYFHAKNSQAIRRLIGRTLQVRFSVPVGRQQKSVLLTGLVQGVQSHPLDEYSVHLKLHRNFSDEAINTIRLIADAS